MTNTLWAIFAAGWAVVVFLVLVFFRGARCADEWDDTDDWRADGARELTDIAEK